MIENEKNESNLNKLTKIGELIDKANDESSLEELINIRNKFPNYISEEKLSNIEKKQYHYYKSILYSGLSRISKTKQNIAFVKKNDYFEKELLNIRLSYNSICNDGDDIYNNSIITNYGNTLNSIGRSFEAIQVYKKVFKFQNSFAMAELNIAICLLNISDSLYDEGHIKLYRSRAKQYLMKALEGELYEKEKTTCISLLNSLKNIDSFEPDKQLNLENSVEYYEIERNYRKWVAENNLFLNPLNDLDIINISFEDIFHLPDIVETGALEKRELYDQFNLIKQEFISSRYLFYKVHDKLFSSHFSDSTNKLFESLNYGPLLSNYYIELIKSCFRNMFSIFNRISVLIHSYFKLKHEINYIDFKQMWDYGQGRNKEPNTTLTENDNKYLMALYWIKEDIFTKDISVIKNIRDYIEHRNLFIHPTHFNDYEKSEKNFHLTDKEMLQHTLELIKLIRASIFYTSMMISTEEKKKSKDFAIGIQLYWKNY